MSRPNEGPRFSETLDDIDIVAVQFMGLGTILVEFSRQVQMKTAMRKLIVNPKGMSWASFKVAAEGFHVWHITMNVVNDVRYPMDVFVTNMLAPEVAGALIAGGSTRKAVLTKNQWLLKSYFESFVAEVERVNWELADHPSGKTNGDLMELEHGWYEIKGYFIWRGTWHNGAKASDGFQSFHTSTNNEQWNKDIRFFLNKGHNLRDAVRIQDEMWMEDFRTMLAALASFYASTPGPGPKPASLAARMKPKSQSGIEKLIHKVEVDSAMAAQAFEAFTAISESLEHAKRVQVEAELSEQIGQDIAELGQFIDRLLVEKSNSTEGL